MKIVINFLIFFFFNCNLHFFFDNIDDILHKKITLLIKCKIFSSHIIYVSIKYYIMYNLHKKYNR